MTSSDPIKVHRTRGLLKRQTSVIGLLVQILGIALTTFYGLLSAWGLDPTSRGQMVFALQLSYLVTSVLASGIERALVSGIHQLQLSIKHRLLLIGVTFTPPVILIGTGDALWLVSALPGVVLATLAVRLNEAQAVGLRDVFMMVRARLLPSLALLMAGTCLVLTNVNSYRLWTLSYLSVFGLFGLLMFPNTSSSSSVGLTDQLSKLAAADLSLAVASRLDRVIMGLAQQHKNLGTYSLIGSMTELSVIPGVFASQLNSNAVGRVSRLTLWSFIGVSIVALSVAPLVGPLLVARTFGSEYAAPIRLWWLLCLASLMLLAFKHLSAILTRNFRYKQLMIASITSAVVSFLGFILLIPRLSGEGAAIATIVGYLAGMTVAVVSIRKVRVTLRPV